MFLGFLVIILIAAVCAWFAVSKALAVIGGAILLFLWARKGVERLAVRREIQEEEKAKHETSRLIGRGGLPRGARSHPGWVQKHGRTEWCDGWGAADGSAGCDGGDGERMSKVVSKRRKAHENDPGIQKK
jgi:hypothetical protein